MFAEEILAKHDENYMPKEVKEELEKSGYYKHAQNTPSDTPSDTPSNTPKVGQ